MNIKEKRLEHVVPLSFTAFGGKIEALRWAGWRWLLKVSSFLFLHDMSFCAMSCPPGTMTCRFAPWPAGLQLSV